MKRSWEAFYAQKGPIFVCNPTHHPFWRNFEWKCRITLTDQDNIQYTLWKITILYRILQFTHNAIIINHTEFCPNLPVLLMSIFSLISFPDFKLLFKILISVIFEFKFEFKIAKFQNRSYLLSFFWWHQRACTTKLITAIIFLPFRCSTLG